MKLINDPMELSCWVLTAFLPEFGAVTRVCYSIERPSTADTDPELSSYFRDLKKAEWDCLTALLETRPDSIQVTGPYDVPEAQVVVSFDQMPPEPVGCHSNLPCSMVLMGPITDEDVLEDASDEGSNTTVIIVDQQRYAATLVSGVVDNDIVNSIINNITSADMLDDEDYTDDIVEQDSDE